MGKDPKEEKKLKQMDATRKEREEKDSAPAIIAFSMEHVRGTGWTFVKLHIKDDKVIKREVKECMDKAHALETFQLEYVGTFIYGQ